MGKVDFKKIWEVYEIPEDQELHHNACQTIRRRWEEYLEASGKSKKSPWERLSESEQDNFIYRVIYDTMMDYYVPERAQAKVRSKVKSYLANSSLMVDERIQTKNDSIVNLFRDHRTTTHSDAKKQEAYKGLCNDIRNYNANIPLPTYKEFEKRLSLNASVCPEDADYEARVQDMEMVYRNIRVYQETLANGEARNDEEARAEDRANAEAAVRAEDARTAEGQPIRAYDYVKDYEATMLNPMLPIEGDTEIYVRIILKVLEEKLGLKVDCDMVNECLLCREEFFEYCRHKGIDWEDDWEFPTEYDEKLDMSIEEYEELKKRYAEYLSCEKKLNDLKPLYKYEKND